MSVSSIPGFDVLQAPVALPKVPGLDALTTAPAATAVPGADALAVSPAATAAQNAAQSPAATTAPATTTNPYQTALNNITVWSGTYLETHMGSAGAASSQDGGALSGVSGLLSELQQGYGAGLYTGTGVDTLA